MSSEKSVTPQIRFKGFTEAWEQRKLGEVFSITMGQSPSSTNYTSNPDDYVLVQGNADLQNGWVYPRVWTTQVTKTADPGTLIMSVRAPVGAMGKTAYKIVLGRGVAGIQGPEILFQLFKKYESEGYWIKKSTGSTFDSINGDELKNTLVTLPNLSSEQTEIEKLLLRLDLLITLHQRKLDVLKKIKSALLEKMFPKDGSDIPEIRFTGFTEAWEQRELGDIAEIIGGGTPDTNNPSYWDGDIDWYSPAELGEQIYAIGSRRRITKEGYKNSSAKLLPANKTILFTSRAGIGTTAILCKSACTNQGFQSLVINDNTDLYFIYSMSSRIKDFAISKASGSTFLEISGKQLATMNLFLPQLNEQRKIGQYFKSLDNLITLHQRKLNALKKIKSALLEKMFV